MSKQSLDLKYMEKAMKVRTGVNAGIVRPLYGVLYGIRYALYGFPAEID